MAERMKLWQRIGQERTARLMAMKRGEERSADLGLREVDEPSRADFELDRALMKTEFTPQERIRIRVALGIDPRQDVEIPARRSVQSEPHPDLRRVISEALRETCTWSESTQSVFDAVTAWLTTRDAQKRAEWEAGQGDRVPESATISYWTELDGDYAEASTTLAQADYVRREARGHIAVSDRKIWKHVEFDIDVPVPDTANTESEGEK